MLRRGLATSILAASLLTLGLPAVVAEESVDCPKAKPYCVIDVEQPAVPGSDEPGGGSPPRGDGPGEPERVCRSRSGVEVDCISEAFGWWSPQHQCWFKPADPQPPRRDPVWQGRYPDGAVYLATCIRVGNGPGGGWMWLPNPPEGYGGPTVTPAQLAARAVDRLPLAGPDIGIAPEPGKTGLVGVPVWMWTREPAATWGPVSATASVPALSVTARAQARLIEWEMGDGQTVVCRNPGTPYEKRLGGGESPTCGHVYARPSVGQPEEAYQVTATTTWQITWSGGGESGALVEQRSSSVPVRIGELQVLVSE